LAGLLTPSALPGEQSGPVRQQAVVAAGVGGSALVEQLQVAGVDGHGLIGVGADEVAVADVVGPGGAAVGFAGEGVALGGGLWGPGAAQAGGGEGAEVAALAADRFDDHQVLVLALDLVDLG